MGKSTACATCELHCEWSPVHNDLSLSGGVLYCSTKLLPGTYRYLPANSYVAVGVFTSQRCLQTSLGQFNLYQLHICCAVQTLSFAAFIRSMAFLSNTTLQCRLEYRRGRIAVQQLPPKRQSTRHLNHFSVFWRQRVEMQETRSKQGDTCRPWSVQWPNNLTILQWVNKRWTWIPVERCRDPTHTSTVPCGDTKGIPG